MYALSCSLYPENSPQCKSVGVNPRNLCCPSVMSVSSLSKYCTKQKCAVGSYQSSWSSLLALEKSHEFQLCLASQIMTPQMGLCLSSERDFADYCSSLTCQYDHIRWVQTFAVLQIRALSDGSKGQREIKCLLHWPMRNWRVADVKLAGGSFKVNKKVVLHSGCN